MGFFDFFGKKAEEAEKDREQEQAAAKEKELQAAKDAHADMEWPGIFRINPVNMHGSEGDSLEDTLTPERKDEIGPMIYEEDIDSDKLSELSGQEVLFLLTALEVFNKKAPLPGFEKNHRKVYNEVLNRIRDSKSLYCLYDKVTGYPYIDHGFASIYFEEDLAEKARDVFEKQNRTVTVREVKVELDTPGGDKKGFFDFLYYVGIENLIIDNGAYRTRFKRNEIVAAPGDWNGTNNAGPSNPALSFAMIDFLTEFNWHVNYEKKAEVLKAKEMRMLSLMRKAQYIIPMQHEGHVEKTEDGRIKMGKDTKLKFLVIKSPDNKEFLPVYTDPIEFSKKLHGSEWNAAVFSYQDILRFVQGKDGIRINPSGHGIILPKDRMMALELAGQQAEQLTRKPTPKTEKDSLQKALDKAITDMDNK